MKIELLLELAAEGMPDRVAVGSRKGGLTYVQLLARARRAAQWVHTTPVDGGTARHLGLLDVNSEFLPVALFGAALARVPFVPVSYRTPDNKLRELVARAAPAVMVTDPEATERIGGVPGIHVVSRTEFATTIEAEPVGGEITCADGDTDENIAVLLFTSGTTGSPKAAILRHRHLVSYILSTGEFGSADPSEATLVSVPPYHIAGVSAILSSLYSGRRLVYLPAFSAPEWVAKAASEEVTHAMVVPTMLGRILDELESTATSLPALAHLSYGGGPMPLPVIDRAMRLLPQVNFVNAYGLTETSSTIALLTPEDHRVAAASDDPGVRARLGSVGRPLPSVELEIRGELGEPLPAGEVGEVWVRGDQIAGEYLATERARRSEGWFCTRDSGYLDPAGYLFLSGRLDDVIVRGGENISPGQIEEVLREHAAVEDAAVVGAPDVRWGERIVAHVVVTPGEQAGKEELKELVRSRLRSTCMPEEIHFTEALPYSETGKLLRRVLRTQHPPMPEPGLTITRTEQM